MNNLLSWSGTRHLFSVFARVTVTEKLVKRGGLYHHIKKDHKLTVEQLQKKLFVIL